jgi:hypothetical protein
MCVGFSECSNSTEFDDGTGKINVRLPAKVEAGDCHYLETCCDPEDIERNLDIPFAPNSTINIPTESQTGESTTESNDKTDKTTIKVNVLSKILPESTDETSPKSTTFSTTDSSDETSTEPDVDNVSFRRSSSKIDSYSHHFCSTAIYQPTNAFHPSFVK